MITEMGVAVPEDMVGALELHPQALRTFQGLRTDDQRNFVDWLAKPGIQTRAERLAELAGHVVEYGRNHGRRITE